jgi:hypothetical protein
MKSRKRIALVCLWLAWLLARPADTLAQGTFAYQQWINPNPRPGVPWDDSGVWVGGSPLNPTPLNIDMNLDGNVDFQITSTSSSLTIFVTGTGEVVALRSTPPDLGGYSTRITTGQPISSLTPMPYEWVESYYFTGPIGTTLLNSTTAGTLGFWGGQFGYLGVRIQENGDWLYGWIRCGVPLSIVPEGIFYEAALNLTPNAGIFAGQIPEPSAWALLSAGGILFWLLGRGKRAA